MWKFLGGLAIGFGGKKLAEDERVKKFAREVRDEVRRGLHETAKGIASAAQDCAEHFAEKPATNDAPKA